MHVSVSFSCKNCLWLLVFLVGHHVPPLHGATPSSNKNDHSEAEDPNHIIRNSDSTVLSGQFLDDYNDVINERKLNIFKIPEKSIFNFLDLDIDTRKKLEVVLQVQAQKFNEYISYLEEVIDVQVVNKIGEGSIRALYNFIGKLTNVIGSDKPKTKLSPSKVSQSIANSKSDGFELMTDGRSSFRNQFLKVGNVTRALGKVAGPIGSVGNIELNIWSLTKSLLRLQNATTSSNNVVADIVKDYMSVAGISSRTTPLSISSPPAAPTSLSVRSAIELLTNFAVAIFQAANEAARVDSRMQISYEERELFLDRTVKVFGRSKSYLEQLLGETAANDAAVKGALKFLQDNIEILGIVIPSRTLSVEDSCTLTFQRCSLRFFWKCLIWDRLQTLGTGCSRGKNCGGKICQTYNQNSNFFGFDQFVCTCTQAQNFGAPRRNQKVDFRQKQNLKWDRAVPRDVSNGVFKCKPGRTNNFDPIATQPNWRTEYLCENAIGLLQPTNRREPGQTLLFILEDGNDTIYLNDGDITPNRFVIGEEGTKNFNGGGGPNEFLLNSTCDKSLRGTLSGGSSDSDSISIGPNCGKGAQISVDFTKNILTGPGPSDNVNINLHNIEHIYGRLNEGDFVIASTSTKLIALKSGSVNNGDNVDIPGCPLCRYDLTIYAGEYTTINSKPSLGEVTTLFETRWQSTSATYDIHPSTELTHNIKFLKTSSQDIGQDSYSSSPIERYVSIGLINSVTSDVVHFRFNFQPSPNPTEVQKIHFTEENDLESVLTVSLANTPFVYHNLPEVMSSINKASKQIVPIPTRVGSKNFENFFDLQNSDWIVTGGDISDEFLLHGEPSAETLIDGGGGDDTLRLHENIKSHTTINLLDTSPFRNIEQIIGHPGNPVTVTCNCNTKLLSLEGGSLTQPDEVIVEPSTCARDLQIVAKGRTTISIDGEVGVIPNDMIHVFANPSEDPTINPREVSIFLNSQNINGFELTAELSNADWEVDTVLIPPSTLQVTLRYKNEILDTIFKNFVVTIPPPREVLLNRAEGNSEYVPIPNILLTLSNSGQPPGLLRIKNVGFVPELLFRLNELLEEGVENPKIVYGLRTITNIFQIENGTWHVIGGDKDDAVLLSPAESVVNIEGGNGENSLLLDGKSSLQNNNTFLINFQDQLIGFPHLGNLGNISQISHLVGRTNKPDNVHCGCDTKTVNGRGGLGSGYRDEIEIPALDCPPQGKMNINIAIPTFTNVENAANEGIFSYLIEDLLTSDLSFTPTQTNLHLIEFAFDPSEIIEDIRFDPATNQLELTLRDSDSTIKIVSFEMYRDPSSTQFTNPVLEFQRPMNDNVNITTDIQIGADGVTSSIIMIKELGNETVKGLPVNINQFLVNITEPGSGTGTLLGSDTSTANHFWLFDLQSQIGLLRGGSSPSQNYLYLEENFGNGEFVEVDLSFEAGYVGVGDFTILISKLENIQHLRGRIYPFFHDGAIVTCDTASVNEVEDVTVSTSKINCEFDLTIGMNQNTFVYFEFDEKDYEEASRADLFTYKFASPRSFTPFYYFSNLARISTHKYLLAFTSQQLESTEFDLAQGILYYDINGTTYNHEMIGGVPEGEEFYAQPIMLTEDGFRIQIHQSGEVHLTLAVNSSLAMSKDTILRATNIPVLTQIAKNTGARIIIQTEEKFIHVGHGGLEGGRNVIQNVGYSESHLVGGGARDTIYDIIDLKKNIFIYPGFQQDGNETEDIKETVDLTDIVAQVRSGSEGKYLPKIGVTKDDIYFEMEEHKDKFPGKLFIADGITKPENTERLQFLLGNSLMDLVADGDDNWKLKPRPLLLPQGGLYTLAREDFEDGQVIRVEEDISTLNTSSTFQSIRNGTDLIMTTLLEPEAEMQREVTTVVLLDYFEKSETQPLSTTGKNNMLAAMNLQVSLPGLDLVLKGTNIQSKGIAISSTQVAEWNESIKNVQDRLLRRIANIA